jgi:uncharacterized RDD family membrane protein YckC
VNAEPGTAPEVREDDRAAEASERRARRRLASLAVALAFLLAFLWELLGAVSNLLAWLGFAAVVHSSLSAFAWVVLAAGIAVPVLTYGATAWLGRRQTPGRLALMLLVAFCASQALTLTVLAVFQRGIGVR